MCANPIYGIDPAAHTVWTYRNDWPDFGLHAPKEKPGLVIAAWGVRGIAPAGGEAGNIFAINSDFGQWYLFTADGLFLSTLFGDTRTAPFWNTHFPDAKYGMLVDGASLGQGEAFSREVRFNKGSDGNVYIVTGHPHLSIVKITGLDTVRRIGGTITVTQIALDHADDVARQSALADRAANGPPIMKFWTESRTTNSPFHPALGTLLGAGANQEWIWPRFDDKYFTVATQLDRFADATPDAPPLTTGDAIVIDLANKSTGGAGVQPHVRAIVTSVGGKARVSIYQYDGDSASATKIVSTKQIEDANVKIETVNLDSGPVVQVTAKIPWGGFSGSHAARAPQDGPDDCVLGDIGIVITDPNGGPSKRLQFGDIFATLGPSNAAMKVDAAMFAKLTRQAKGE